jgi:hypothetical protein
VRRKYHSDWIRDKQWTVDMRRELTVEDSLASSKKRFKVKGVRVRRYCFKSA